MKEILNKIAYNVLSALYQPCLFFFMQKKKIGKRKI